MSSRTPDDPPPTDASRLRELFEQCLSRMDHDGPEALDQFCAEHPQEAPEIRRRLDKLGVLGLLPQATPGSGGGSKGSLLDGAHHDAVPEQLGDYRLGEILGGGGMGVVYHARQTSLDRDVALKLIRPEMLHVTRARLRFEREVAAIARLSHPGIVPVYEVGEENGVPYFTMERVDGVSLTEAMRVLGRSPDCAWTGSRLAGLLGNNAATDQPTPASLSGPWTQVALRLTLQVAEALQHAHEHGVLHRDVKPSNVMLTPDGRAQLLDFGLASTDDLAKITRTGSQLGSLPSMAPEQVRGQFDELTPTTDVYALGLILYELLTRTQPFLRGGSTEVEQRILRGDFPPPRQLQPQIPIDVEFVCRKALQLNPADRYRSAGAFAADLRCLLEHRPVEAGPPHVSLRLRRWGQRNPTRAVVASLAALLTVVGFPAAAFLQTWAIGRVEAATSRERDTIAELVSTNRRLETTLAQGLTQRQLAEERLGEFLRLSDWNALRRLHLRSSELWPARIERAPAMRQWLDEADALGSRLPDHVAALADLESPDFASSLPGQTDLEWWRSTLQSLIGELTSFRGEDGEDGEVDQVRRRLARAETIAADTVEKFEAEWDEAIHEIALHPEYDGVELEPIVGLVPLGPDPDSGLWEFWHTETGNRPVRGPDARWQLEDDTGMILVLIPGAFDQIGAQADVPDLPRYHAEARPNELLRDVDLDPFLLAKFEMTQGQWGHLTGEWPSHFQVKRTAQYLDATYPVESVSWAECQTVLLRVGLSLPTEAQWEIAASAAAPTPWWTGHEFEDLHGRANTCDQSFMQRYGSNGFVASWDDGYGATSPVGAFPANPYGLHDVVGNLAEWCWDAYFYEPDLELRGGDGRSAPSEERRRVVRGGSFQSSPPQARTAHRDHHMVDEQQGFIGVRPAMTAVAR